jgi:hypothetical protein
MYLNLTLIVIIVMIRGDLALKPNESSKDFIKIARARQTCTGEIIMALIEF